MSTNLLSSKISRLQREIQRLQRDSAKLSKDEASKTKRISQVQKSVTRNTSAASVRSKQREIDRLQTQIVGILEKRAQLDKKIADRTVELHTAQRKLSSAQAEEQQKFIDSIRRAEQTTQQQLLHEISQARGRISMAAGGRHPGENNESYDFFISHAHEDKDDLVRPLAEALQERGLVVWYDEFELKVGDSLRRSIDRGLAKSRFGIVVLSPSFFAKNWTQYELDGLVAKEMLGGKVILPIWHKVSKNEVLGYSPSLADKVALSTSQYTVEELADRLVDAIGTA